MQRRCKTDAEDGALLTTKRAVPLESHGPRRACEGVSIVAAHDVILFCPHEYGLRRHRYQRTSYIPLDTVPDPDLTLAPRVRAEIIYACRLCEHERLLAIVILCGPRSPSPVKRPRGRPRKILT